MYKMFFFLNSGQSNGDKYSAVSDARTCSYCPALTRTKIQPFKRHSSYSHDLKRRKQIMSLSDDIQQNILDVIRTWQDGLVLNETRARTMKKVKKKKIYKETRSNKVNIKMIQQLTINKNNKNIGA